MNGCTNSDMGSEEGDGTKSGALVMRVPLSQTEEEICIMLSTGRKDIERRGTWFKAYLATKRYRERGKVCRLLDVDASPAW